MPVSDLPPIYDPSCREIQIPDYLKWRREIEVTFWTPHDPNRFTFDLIHRIADPLIDIDGFWLLVGYGPSKGRDEATGRWGMTVGYHQPRNVDLVGWHVFHHRGISRFRTDRQIDNDDPAE